MPPTICRPLGQRGWPRSAVAWGVFPAETLAAERPDRLVRTVDELAAVLGLDRPV